MSENHFRRFAGSRPGAALRRVMQDRAGGVAMLVAILAPVLIGSAGLGAETGYWYLTQRMVQSAADVAAHGAGNSKLAGGVPGAMQTTADYLVTEAGISAEDRTVVPNNPPTSGAYKDDTAAVEVIVTKGIPRMFSAIFLDDRMNVSGRAVALMYPGALGCVLALSKTAQGAITVSGASDSSMALCDMVSNASGTAFEMTGNSASVSANCIQTVGTAATTSQLTVACKHLREHAKPIEDPFAGVPEPAMTGTCHSGSVGSNNQTITESADESHGSGMLSRRYCNGLSVTGTVTFSPGVYLIEGGDFTINSNANVLGDGVVFYLAPGVNLKFNGTATVDLSPPTSGTYAGILIFGSRSSTGTTHALNGNLGSTLDGAIYAPSSHLTLSGNVATTGGSCTQFVTNTVTFSGSGAININCENPIGPAIVVPDWVALVE